MGADAKISFCASVAAAPRPAPLAATLEAIRSGKWGMLVTRVRAAQPGPDRDKVKKGLPGIVFAGLFSARRKDALKAHSGILCLDLDGKDNPAETPSTMRAKAIAAPQTLACFVSPSGEGLKVLVAVAGEDGQPPHDADTHERCFRAAEAYYRDELGLIVDPSGKDVCRLCFVSHDPGLWRRPAGQAAAPFLPAAPAPAPVAAPTAPVRPAAGRPSVIDRAAKYLAKLPPAISGQKGHDALYDAALALVVGFGLDEAEALDLLARDYNPRCQPPWSDRELLHKVKSAAANASNLPVGYLRDKPDKRPSAVAARGNARRAPAAAPAPEEKSGAAAPGGIGAGPVIPPATDACAQPDAYPHSDDGNAMRMRDAHGDELRHSDAKEWLRWDGLRWRRGAEKDVAKLWRELVARMRALASTPEAIRWADKCGNAAPVTNMTKLLESQDGIDCRDADFDPVGDFLPVANGVIDLTTGALRADHRPEDMNTKLCRVDYDPDARSDAWDAFLADLCTPEGAAAPDEALMEYLQEAAGYSLTPHLSEQAVFILIGAGRNGKSTFLDAIAAVFGEYAGRVATETFSLSRNQSSNARELALRDQQGLRLTIGTETPGDMRLDEALVKTLTETTLTGRGLYQKSVTFSNTTHLWLYGNHRPRVNGGDLGIWRRLKLVELSSVIPADKVDVTLSPRLREPEAQRAILAWMVAGARKWYDNGRHLAEPVAVRDATKRWRQDEDKIGLWLEECTDWDADGRWSPTLAKAYANFSEWCKSCGIGAPGRQSFAADLCAWTGGAPTPPISLWDDGHGRKYVRGLSLRDDD